MHCSVTPVRAGLATAVLAAAGVAAIDVVAWACEDEHPPAIRTPVKEFALRDAAGDVVVDLAFDPRGLGAVGPANDEAKHWTDGRDDYAWHYREWQWWKAHPWGDSCRPRYWTTADFSVEGNQQPTASIAYRIDGFDCRQLFLLPDSVSADAPYWDVLTTIKNASGDDVEEYGQFFACYTPLNRGRSFWFWDAADELVRFADRGVDHLDGYVVHPEAYFRSGGAIPHCPRGGGKIVGAWRRPVMVSQASPAGWRSVIMIEADRCASLAQGMSGVAMDYILFPGPQQRVFADGDEFSVHIRHVMLKSPELPTTERLARLWDDFAASHDAVRGRAAGK